MAKVKLVRAFDPLAGEAAFEKLESRLRGLAADEVAIPNSDPQDSAIAGLALVDVAREPRRRARFSLLPEELISKTSVEQLELASWATWYAHTRMLSEVAGASGAKVDATLYEKSGQHLSKMLKVLEYHVGEAPEVAAEIAGIRSGTGYQDRASDLVRAAALVERYRAELEGDERWFDESDAALARTYAEQIVQSLRSSMQSRAADWTDLRNRAWTELNRWYNEVRAAGEFVFRAEPGERDLFLPLRQAVSPTRPRTVRHDEAPASPSPAEPASPSPAEPTAD
jgi:hypothetical protein